MENELTEHTLTNAFCVHFYVSPSVSLSSLTEEVMVVCMSR